MRVEQARKIFGLGVQHEIDESELKKFYHREALKCHPDKHADDPSATQRFQQLSEAYGILIGEADASVSEDDDWSDDDYPTQNAGRQRSQRTKKAKAKEQKGKKQAKPRKQRPGQKRRNRRGAMDEGGAKDLFERLFGKDVLIMEGADGNPVLLSFGSGGKRSPAEKRKAEAERARAETVRRRQAGAFAAHGFGERHLDQSGTIASGEKIKDPREALGAMGDARYRRFQNEADAATATPASASGAHHQVRNHQYRPTASTSSVCPVVH